MAKYFGMIGFGVSRQIRPGVWEEAITPRPYAGDWMRNTQRMENAGQVNDDISINNQLSIVADPYARENFHMMRYVEYMGAKWKVTGVEVQYPRLILTIGGVYNGPDP